MTNRKTIIRIFTFLGGIYFFLEFILPEFVGIDAYHDQISIGFTAVGTMAVGLGIINLFSIHGRRILFLRPGFSNSLALLLGLLLMLVISIGDWLSTMQVAKEGQKISHLAEFSERIAEDYLSNAKEVKPFYVRNEKLKEGLEVLVLELKESLERESTRDFGEAHLARTKFFDQMQALSAKLVEVMAIVAKIEVDPQVSPTFEVNKVLKVLLGQVFQNRRAMLEIIYEHSTTKNLYRLLYNGLFVSLGSAMFSLLGFYMASAAFRAFRIRSIESALMMMAALLVMLGQIPFGIWLWEGFSDSRFLLLSTPSTAVFRAIKIGAAVAGLVMAFRMWFSIESETFGDKGV